MTMKKLIQGMLASAVLIGTAAMMMGAAAPGASAVDARGSFSPDEAIPLDANACGDRCNACESRCSRKTGQDEADCKANCHDSNASCCEANGKRASGSADGSRSCGCR